MTDWADAIVNPRSYPSDVPSGQDPIIGQQPNNGRQRSLTLRIDAQTFETITLPSDFVTVTGGDYFFAPSITALQTVLAAA
jgi:hypothetical protein